MNLIEYVYQYFAELWYSFFPKKIKASSSLVYARRRVGGRLIENCSIKLLNDKIEIQGGFVTVPSCNEITYYNDKSFEDMK